MPARSFFRRSRDAFFARFAETESHLLNFDACLSSRHLPIGLLYTRSAIDLKRRNTPDRTGARCPHFSHAAEKRADAPFVLIEPPAARVLSYYTLSASLVDARELPDTLAKKLPRYPQLPVTLLGRLAVDQSVKGRGLGELLLIDALRRSLEAAANIAAIVCFRESSTSCSIITIVYRSHKAWSNPYLTPLQKYRY